MWIWVERTLSKRITKIYKDNVWTSSFAGPTTGSLDQFAGSIWNIGWKEGAVLEECIEISWVVVMCWHQPLYIFAYIYTSKWIPVQSSISVCQFEQLHLFWMITVTLVITFSLEWTVLFPDFFQTFFLKRTFSFLSYRLAGTGRLWRAVITWASRLQLAASSL